MSRRFVLIAVALLGCQPVPDPITQAFEPQPLELPTTFEGLPRAGRSDLSAEVTRLASNIYLADSFDSFSYGSGAISGFAIAYASDFDAQRTHQDVIRSLERYTRVSSNESQTLWSYDAYYRVHERVPHLVFHLGNHNVYVEAAPSGVSDTQSLRDAIAFAEHVFDLNGRLGTEPLRPFQLDPLNISPPVDIPVQPGPTRFTFDINYIVEDQPSAFVSARVRWFKAGRGAIEYADSVRVQRGTGKVSFTLDADLSDAILSDILSIRAHISYPNPDGSGSMVVPPTGILAPIRFDIARTN